MPLSDGGSGLTSIGLLRVVVLFTVEGLLEITDTLTQRAADLGEFAGAKDDQGDDHNISSATSLITDYRPDTRVIVDVRYNVPAPVHGVGAAPVWCAVNVLRGHAANGVRGRGRTGTA